MPYPPAGPNVSQRRFHAAVETARWTAFLGGIRCGKSRAGYEALNQLLARHPGSKALICRKFEEDLNDSCIVPYLEVTPSRLLAKAKNKGKFQPWHNGSSVTFKGLYTRNAYRAQKMGSLTFRFIMVEEAEELEESDFKVLIGRLSQPPAPIQRGWLVANPPMATHWIPRLFVPPYATVIGKTEDNVEHLGQEYLDEVTRMYQGPWAQRFLSGEIGFSLKGTPVIEGFTPEHVVSRDYRQDLPFIRAWDFGYQHPCVDFLQYDGSHWHWFDTLMGTNTYLEDFVPAVIARGLTWSKQPVYKDCCDFSGTFKRDNTDQTSVDILGSFGIYAASKKTISVFSGASKIQAAVTAGRLTVEPTNLLGRDCLAGGWQSETGREGKDQDSFKQLRDGHFEHCADPLRYAFEHEEIFRPEPSKTSYAPGTLGFYKAQMNKARHRMGLLGHEREGLADALRAVGSPL